MLERVHARDSRPTQTYTNADWYLAPTGGIKLMHEDFRYTENELQE